MRKKLFTKKFYSFSLGIILVILSPISIAYFNSDLGAVMALIFLFIGLGLLFVIYPNTDTVKNEI